MLELLFSTIAIYIIYYIASIRKFDKSGNAKISKKENKEKRSKAEIICDNYAALPVEVKFFIKKYNINLEKVNNKGLLKVIGFILGINIAVITIIISLFIKQDVLIQILIVSLLLIPAYLLSLVFLAKYFKKKGLVQDERIKKSKRNRK